MANSIAHSRVLAFATQGTGGNEEKRILSLLSHLKTEVIPYDRSHKTRNFFNIIRKISSVRPDLVVMEGTGIAGGAAVILGRWIFGVPYIVSSGDAVGPFVKMLHPVIGHFFSLYEKILCASAAGFIGWTPYLVGRALTLGTRRGMTAAGWAHFTLSEDERSEARARVRKELGILESSIVIGIAGALNWNSRVEYCYGLELVKALQQLKRKDVVALIVGSGEGAALLKEMAGPLLGHSIFFTGRVPLEKVPEMLATMDLASLPQSVDQVGSFRYTTKLSEILSMGLPVVTNQIPLAYDLPGNWTWRLPGNAPWEPTFYTALASLLEGIDRHQILEKKKSIPPLLHEFDKDSQIQRVTDFVGDILDQIPSG